MPDEPIADHSPETPSAGKRLAAAVKRAVGIEGSARQALLPMFAYSSANIGMAATSMISGPYYLLFLTKVEGFSTGAATLMGFLRSVWDAVIDPFIGFAVDRTRTALGKHRLYIILTAVPYGLSFAMLFTSFGISGKEGAAAQLLAYHLFAGMLFALVGSVLGISHGAMLPGLAKGYMERTQYNSMGMMMNSVGMMPAQFLGTAMVGIRATKEFDPSMRPTMFKMALIVGLFAIAPILLSGLATRERSSKEDIFPPLNVRAFFREFTLVFRNKAFRQYFSMTFLYLFGASFFSVAKPFFLQEVARRWDLNSQLSLVQGAFEMLMFPINYGLTKKFGKQKCAWITTPMLFLCYALGFLIAPQAPGSKSLAVWLLLFAREITYIIGYSGFGFMRDNIYPDVTDVDEMITGRRREAIISTFNSFIKTMISGFMASIVGILLEWFGVSKDSTKYSLLKEARAANLHRSLTPSFGLKFSNAFLPILFMAFALRSLRRYKMTQADHELIRRAIAQRHETGEAAVTDEERARLEEIAGQAWEAMWVGGAAAENNAAAISRFHIGTTTSRP